MKNSLAVAIEALSWMAYESLGERSAFSKASDQLNVKRLDELRQAHRLIIETTRFQNRLDYFISQTIPDNEIQKIPHGIRSLLRIVAYLRHVDGANQRELVRTVEAARQVLGWRELQPFEVPVAKILSGTVTLQVDAASEYEHLALETCHPAWFVERVVGVFGRSLALQVLRSNLQPTDTYARLNSLKVTGEARKEEILRQLGEPVGGLPDVFVLAKRGRPFDLIESGEVIIQDFASTLAGCVASPRPGGIALDVCAAPGNKTSHLAAQMQNDGIIYSLDVSARRLSFWATQMRRCGCRIAAPIRADARRVPLSSEADVVLVDPPCSNSGVFARNPSGKWNMTQARVNALSLRQTAILRAASERVRVGGTLVYCTCSILPEENEYIIEGFLRDNPDFKLVPQSPFLGAPGLRGFDLCQRFYPHIHRCNGYFIAKLLRTG